MLDFILEVRRSYPFPYDFTGGIILTGEGQVKLGNGVSFVGTVVPIEIASSKGARIIMTQKAVVTDFYILAC